MPIPIPYPSPDEAQPRPPGRAPAGPRPYYVREPQGWAIDQERQRHVQALYTIGEWVFFYLMWHQLDHSRGLVARCSRCYGGAGGVDARITAVYDQPTQNGCPVCFGTTFEGGWRARIVRPAIVADVEETERQDKRGSMHPASMSVETTVDFRCRAGDYMIRADGSRWQLGSVQRMQVRNGFQHAAQDDEGIGLKMRAALEEETTVAFRLPPIGRAQIRSILGQPMRFPGNFTEHEDQRAPLIPASILE